MSLAKVQKQLVRDLKRSPAKAAALGLLCVVALWFWAPLIGGWFGKERPKPAKPAEQAVALIPAEPQGTGSANQPATASVPWQNVVGWIENDRRMQSASLAEAESPPFVRQRADLADPGEAENKTVDVAKESFLDVTQLGLKLTSTMLGPRRRVAVINGRPYAEGVELELGEAVVFVVARVTDRSVLLERNGRRFELLMAGAGK